ncbi:MAG TPA: carboxypeptidase regulatory-like domain-containing protein [Eoetvoesiella sp.]
MFTSAPCSLGLKTVVTIVFSTVLLIGAAVYNPAHAQLPPSQHYGGTEYVSGGIGYDESTAFKAAMPQFPLALTFASKAGNRAAYVSDVQVVIRDPQDNTILNAKANGPYFLVKLPPGQYNIFATYNTQTLSQKVAVNSTGTAQAIFEWK